MKGSYIPTDPSLFGFYPNGLTGHSAYPTNTAILQRVLSASVTVDQKVVSSISNGILVLAAMAPGDTEKDAERLASKILKLKLWDDDSGGRWKRSVQDINGEVLCVSQFTLLASTKKGNKPDFHGALNGDEARRLYDCFYRNVQEGYIPGKVQNGVFQAMMQVALVNDGPVTIEITAGQTDKKAEKTTTADAPTWWKKFLSWFLGGLSTP